MKEEKKGSGAGLAQALARSSRNCASYPTRPTSPVWGTPRHSAGHGRKIRRREELQCLRVDSGGELAGGAVVLSGAGACGGGAGGQGSGVRL